MRASVRECARSMCVLGCVCVCIECTCVCQCAWRSSDMAGAQLSAHFFCLFVCLFNQKNIDDIIVKIPPIAATDSQFRTAIVSRHSLRRQAGQLNRLNQVHCLINGPLSVAAACPSSHGAVQTLSLFDDDELMLNVLRCHLTY